MNELPINLHAHEVRSLLQSNFTTIFRVIEPQPCAGFEANPDYNDIAPSGRTGPLFLWDGEKDIFYPFGDKGMRSYVRETWGIPSFYDHVEAKRWPSIEHVTYAATDSTAAVMLRAADQMPPHYSRLKVEITGYFIEQLENLSAEDVLNVVTVYERENGAGKPALSPQTWLWCLQLKVVREGDEDEFETIEYNKLVRDKMRRVVRMDGNEAEFRTLEREEFHHELKRKLCEEAGEYFDSGDITELADVFDVVLTIAKEYHGGVCEVANVAAHKNKERGGFAQRLFMIWAKKRKGASTT